MMEANQQPRDILEKIEAAEMILIGLGEELDQRKNLRERGYAQGREQLEQADLLWLLPEWERYLRTREENDLLRQRLESLAELLHGKNYFVVSTAMTSEVQECVWKEGRIVSPCGTGRQKQCVEVCTKELYPLTEQDEESLINSMQALQRGENLVRLEPPLGRCEHCGHPYVRNNIYAQNYNEEGYLTDWNRYTKWLQGTLNHKLLVLELGVGMQYPSVIRWPFEKVAFFNQKAEFVRVHESLYQLSEDLKGKGYSISQNAIDWLGTLC